MNEHIKLSVNIIKIATLRNARGGDVPNVLKTALDCERFGAEGIQFTQDPTKGTSPQRCGGIGPGCNH